MSVGALAAGATALLAAVWWVDDDGDPWSTLTAAVAAIPEDGSFTLDHRPLGTRVLDCFTPARELSVEVDLDRRSMRIRDDRGREVARRVGRDVYLPAASVGLAGAWHVLRLPIEESARSRLLEVIGVDAAGYLLADGLPAPAAESVRELLESASTVAALGAGRYRLELDADALGGDIAGASIEVTLAGGEVREVVVRTSETEQRGWGVRYHDNRPVIARPERAARLTGFALMEAAAPIEDSCELSL